MIPIDLLADEAKAIAVAVSRGTPKKGASSEARIRSLVTWQRHWDASSKGRWTHLLIPTVTDAADHICTGLGMSMNPFAWSAAAAQSKTQNISCLNASGSITSDKGWQT
ncbi:uncharacterized protein LOC124460999 [Drosophila willistoni]|uniref:uncharacterized protein LOC124460999 n=1 Tax=Drosophila willistoni TaxID=7260 RepID=UPI001F082D12|nr:uncharacterized protein LOC124460999 [Drosophila willistoni]